MEIEARFINLDQKKVEQSLKSIGARKVSESFFREWIFEYPEWSKDVRRLRVRTDGAVTWLTYKANPTFEVDSTEEIETTVFSSEEIIRILKAVGIPMTRYQEKKRIKYRLQDIIFDLDFWPRIPMVVEIEAPTEEKVKEGAAMLGLSWDDAIFVDQKVVHKQYYGIDLNTIAEYKFEK